jgi:ribulose-phosphate 3-epimerase
VVPGGDADVRHRQLTRGGVVAIETTRSTDNYSSRWGQAPLNRLSKHLFWSDRHELGSPEVLGASCMSISRILDDLHAATPLVAPSLLSCDFAELREEIRRVEEGGARLLHLDIMDGHFVPNLSFGLPVVEAVRRSTDLPLDVHLMISEPARYVRPFREAGADLLTVHIEVLEDPRPLLQEIRKLGAGVGISLNPPTPVESIEGCLDLCDLVLVMSVMPGFGGQEFDPAALEKLRRLRASLGHNVLLSVDGGVNRDTVGACAEAGADAFVTGSALFSQEDYGRFIQQMTGLARLGKEVRV